MLLPAKWRIPVRICICCKAVFERRLFEYTSSLSNASYYGVGDFSRKVKCSPFFGLKSSRDQERTRPLSFRGSQNGLQAQAVGSDSVYDVTCVKWMGDQAKTPPEAVGQKVRTWLSPSLTAGKVPPFTPCPLRMFIKLSCFGESWERFDNIFQGNYYFEGFPFLLFSFSGASVVQKVDFHTQPALAPPD